MSRKSASIALFAIVAVAVSAGPAFAQATADEARLLREIGETYFGRLADGTPPVVTVEPVGDHYRVAVDLRQFSIRWLKAHPTARIPLLSDDTAAAAFDLKKTDDGMWLFRRHDDRIDYSYVWTGERTDYHGEGIEWSWSVDPITGSISNFVMREAKSVATGSTVAKDAVAHTTSTASERNTVVTGHLSKTSDLGFDGELSEWSEETAISLDVDPGKAATQPAFFVNFSNRPARSKLSVSGLRVTQLASLWRSVISRMDAPGQAFDQARLKELYAATLPIFERLTASMELRDFSATTNVAVFDASKLDIGMEASGVKDGADYAFSFGVTDFKARSIFLPAWAKELVPTEFSGRIHPSGYNFASFFKYALESVDYTAADPLHNMDKEHAMSLLANQNPIDMDRTELRMRGRDYELSIVGDMSLEFGTISGVFDVTATGLDRVFDTVSAAAASDPTARAAAGQLAAWRDRAVRKGDTLTWHLDIADGQTKVNGEPMR